MIKKRLLIILSILLIATSVFAWTVQDAHKAVIASMNAAAPSGWSDDFDGGAVSNLDARTGWETTKNVGNKTAHSTDLTIEVKSGDDDEVVRDDENGVTLACMAEYTLADADYSVQAEVHMANENEGEFLYAVGVRLADNSTGMDGYWIRISPYYNFLNIIKCVDGSESTILTNDEITNLNWTAYQTVKITISGSATTTINVYIEDSLESTVEDSSSPITAKGFGGIVGSWSTGETNNYLDDFEIIE